MPGFLLRRRPTMPPFIPSLVHDHYHIIGRRCAGLYFFLEIQLFSGRWQVIIVVFPGQVRRYAPKKLWFSNVVMADLLFVDPFLARE